MYSTEAKELAGQFSRIDSDVYGNPRYYIAQFDLPPAIRAKRLALGIVKYRGRRYGPGFVVQSYNLESDCETFLKAAADNAPA